MPRGSLEDLLIKDSKPQRQTIRFLLACFSRCGCSLQSIVTFAIESATALAHLHANQPEPVRSFHRTDAIAVCQMLHCDFALRNLLLDGAGVVRVSDFGLAMKAPKTEEVKETQKPVAWTSPEGSLLFAALHFVQL